LDRELPANWTRELQDLLGETIRGESILSKPKGRNVFNHAVRSRPGDVVAQARSVLGDLECFAGDRRRRQQRQARLSALVEKLAAPSLLDEFVVVPLNKVAASVAKFDVRLREHSLQAARVVQTILTRMVVFHCDVCRERFPAFHPAYTPPEELGLELLRPGKRGVALCNTQVAVWNDLPPPPKAPEEELLIATCHSGVCLGCQRDMDEQRHALGPEREIVPRRSRWNVMDPCWTFPHEELQWLFDQATVVEEQFVALEHMQVNFVTVYRTGLSVFRRNVISFPQDIAAFAARFGFGRGYKVDDRVNCWLRPGDDLKRARVTRGTATQRELALFAVDPDQYVVFSATVKDVLDNGTYVLEYDHGGEGVASVSDLQPRVRMPWHPKFMQGQFRLMLRRVQYGRVIEGCEIRWDYVCKVLEALTKLGRWRVERGPSGPADVAEGVSWRDVPGVGPMHKWYDPGLFDLLSREEVLETHAPQVWQGSYVSAEEAKALRARGEVVEGKDVRTAADFVQAGLPVQLVTVPGEQESKEDDRLSEVAVSVDEDLFCKWLEWQPLRYGQSVADWWQMQGEGLDGGVAALKVANEESAADLFARIREGCDKAHVALPAGEGQSGSITPLGLAEWIRRHVGPSVEALSCKEESVEELAEHLVMEIAVAAGHSGGVYNTGTREVKRQGEDVEEETKQTADELIAGWPRVHAEPRAVRSRGRFAKSFPLQFPMGIADLYDDRPIEVSPEEWVQHMLRYWTGQFVRSRSGHRVVWAAVNTVLILEACKRGFGVYKNVKRRLGFGQGLGGGNVLTRGRLKEMRESEDLVRSLVYQLQTVGRDVRATSTQLQYEGKKLDAAVRHMSALPPWLRVEAGQPAHWALKGNAMVDDVVGGGRCPATWWTLNCKYNDAYDIHRLNVGAEFGLEALTDPEDSCAGVRRQFVYDSPDFAAYMIALRMELQMRVLMPTLVPHNERQKFRAMSRAEAGPSGNLHHHGVAVGAGNPTLGRVVEEETEGGELGKTAVGGDCAKAEADEALAGPECDGVAVPRELDFAATGGGEGSEGQPAADSEAADSEGAEAGQESPPPPEADAEIQEAMAQRGARRGKVRVAVRSELLAPGPAPSKAEGAMGFDLGSATRAQQEEKFGEYFEHLVSEWNPCYTDEGRVRYLWDEEVKAHDVEVWTELTGGTPERVNLRAVLDHVMSAADRGEAVNLEPVRRLVAALVQRSERHTMHGYRAPRLGKDPCARGKPECPFCRYGFPQERLARGGGRRCMLQKGEREGQWSIRFPRNDGLCCSYDPHLLLCNMGNIDWRPCLNLWAVCEYITKYATKAPKGSRKLGVVVREVMDEVCRYGKEGGDDLLKRTCQKVFARTLGDRDFGIYEAVYLGLNLPVVMSMMPVVSINTLGTRRLKTFAEQKQEGMGDDVKVAHDSMLDSFDRRLAIVKKQFGGKGQERALEQWKLEVRDVSVYEFFWKYRFSRGRIFRVASPVCLMVTPSISADCAAVDNGAHERYARTCVVAYWRLMSTVQRHELLKSMVAENRIQVSSVITWGATELKDPRHYAGAGGEDRDSYLGVDDLVMAFDGKPQGWALGLLEMLVDPVLYEWVPQWVVEQYVRWNPTFLETLAEVVRDATCGDGKHGVSDKDNRSLLRKVHELLVRANKQEEARQAARPGGDEEAPGGVEVPVSGHASEDEGAHDDLEAEVDAALDAGEESRKKERLRWDYEKPAVAAGDPEGGVCENHWSNLSVAQQLSAAGPGVSHDAVRSSEMSGADDADRGLVNPVGFPWRSAVPLVEYGRLQSCMDAWKDSAVGGEDADDEPEKLSDPWQRFAFDIAELKAEERDKRKQMLRGYKPLRMFLTGTAGSGKSRVIRTITKRRRRRVAALGAAEAEVRNAVILAAPTGTASFQMKYGACTLHRAYGVKVSGYCGPERHRHYESFVKRQTRLKQARLAVNDEVSMIGRVMHGKMDFLVEDAIGEIARSRYGDDTPSFGGLDLIEAGDLRQATPIGDSSIFVEGPYTGLGLNKPADGERPDDAPSMEQLTARGLGLRNEMEDVVFLRRVFRLDTGSASGAAGAGGAADEYALEAQKFKEVMLRFADLTWTREDYKWLCKRNRSRLLMTEEGREQLKLFEGWAEGHAAPVLMDTRVDAAAGDHGADRVNLAELKKVARRMGRKIAKIRARHGKTEEAEGVDVDELADDDFRGLALYLFSCEGARVLLTRNLWVEAGLVNGAVGTVKGFMWPDGGDPGSADPKLASPHIVFVEFDNVNLTDAKGVERTFFPHDPPKDVAGSRRNWVPIFMDKASASTEKGVSRAQFPLMLAYALTHWKAQGMTLRRVRIRLGKRIAGTPGVGFVAATRVKHPRDLVFDTDLPSYEDFMLAATKPGFRARARFIQRLYAKASKTSRRYGFCTADPWSRKEADMAASLLRRLEVKAQRQRDSLEGQGLRVDGDTWLWPDGEPNYESMLVGEARAFACGDDVCLQEYLAVVDKLLDRHLSEEERPLHVAAVKEALGCLIPEALHQKCDRAAAKASRPAAERGGVDLCADGWSLASFKEQALVENREVLKDVLEFFLIVARRIASSLELPVQVASHELGHRVGVECDLQELCRSVECWAQWRARAVYTAEEWLVPVCVDLGSRLRDWIFVRVVAAQAGQKLGVAAKLIVEVYDRAQRPQLAKRVASALEALVMGGPRGSASNVEVRVVPGPRSDARDSIVAVLGLVYYYVAQRAGVRKLDVQSPRFVCDVRIVMDRAYGALREEVQAVGEKDVVRVLGDADVCRKLLDELGDPPKEAGGDVKVTVPRRLREVRLVQEAGPFEPLTLLTWNIAGVGVGGRVAKAAKAPSTWSAADNVMEVQRLVRRWRPSVFALQECPGPEALMMLRKDYSLVGSAQSHCGYVHLYCQRGLQTDAVAMEGAEPCVAARLTVDGVILAVVACHLPSGKSDQLRSQRKACVRRALARCSAVTSVVLGDTNAEEDEVQAWCAELDLVDADYRGMSWCPRASQYYGPDHPYQGPGFKYDRVLFGGGVWAAAFLVGHQWVVSDAARFRLSDHFGVLSLLDVHGCYRRGCLGDVGFAETRRGMLASLRNEAAMTEQAQVAAEEAAGREDMVLQSKRVAEAELTAQIASRKKEHARRAKRLKQLEEGAFGVSSLFAAHVTSRLGAAAEVPVLPEDVAIAALKGMAALRSGTVWGGASAERFPRVRGLCNPGCRSYALVVVQMLLRIPALFVWLAKHAGQCEHGGSCQHDCLACALWATRTSLGLRRVPEFLYAVQRHFGTVFKSGSEHDVAALLKRVLESMRALEIGAGRCGAWLEGDGGTVATHVDRLCSFYLEVRSRCAVCRKVDVRFEHQHVLALPNPGEGVDRVSLTELYVMMCGAREAVVDGSPAAGCTTGGCRNTSGACVSQCRLVSRPNVLFVQLQRVDARGAVLRYAVDVDEVLPFPGIAGMELCAVVYRVGRSTEAARYTCACRCADDSFRHFDDAFPAQVVAGDISQELSRAAYLLVYTRTRGMAVFAEAMEEEAGAAALAYDLSLIDQRVEQPERERPKTLRRLRRKVTVEEASGPVEGAQAAVVEEQDVGDASAASQLSPVVSTIVSAPRGVAVDDCAVTVEEGEDVELATGARQSGEPRRLRRRLSRKQSAESANQVSSLHVASSAIAAGAGVQQSPTRPCLKRGRPEKPSVGDGSDSDGVEVLTGVSEQAWRRFTPKVIRPELCQARTWDDGRGGQCQRKPRADSDLCTSHWKDQALALGRVSGEMSEGKLREFLDAAVKRRRVTGRGLKRLVAVKQEVVELQGALRQGDTLQQETALEVPRESARADVHTESATPLEETDDLHLQGGDQAQVEREQKRCALIARAHACVVAERSRLPGGFLRRRRPAKRVADEAVVDGVAALGAGTGERDVGRAAVVATTAAKRGGDSHDGPPPPAGHAPSPASGEQSGCLGEAMAGDGEEIREVVLASAQSEWLDAFALVLRVGNEKIGFGPLADVAREEVARQDAWFTHRATQVGFVTLFGNAASASTFQDFARARVCFTDEEVDRGRGNLAEGIDMLAGVASRRSDGTRTGEPSMSEHRLRALDEVVVFGDLVIAEGAFQGRTLLSVLQDRREGLAVGSVSPGHERCVAAWDKYGFTDVDVRAELERRRALLSAARRVAPESGDGRVRSGATVREMLQRGAKSGVSAGTSGPVPDDVSAAPLLQSAVDCPQGHEPTELPELLRDSPPPEIVASSSSTTASEAAGPSEPRAAASVMVGPVVTTPASSSAGAPAVVGRRGVRATSTSGDGCFGAARRGQLRQELERSRRRQLATSGTITSGPSSGRPQPNAPLCTRKEHTCAIDLENGCTSCRRSCHRDCTDKLCAFDACAFCLSHGIRMPADSQECRDVQSRQGCHACGNKTCWTSSAHCSGSQCGPPLIESRSSPTGPSSAGALVTCTALRHICDEDNRRGCTACNKTCHVSPESSLCGFYGQERGRLSWQPAAQDLRDTRMFRQELRGNLPHRTEFRWRRVGRSDHGDRVVLIDRQHYFVAGAAGYGNNCLIYTLAQCLDIVVNVQAIRCDLMRDFHMACGPSCDETHRNCTDTCMKVYARDYLNSDHWEPVVRLLGRHCATGPVLFDTSQFCVRLIELTWQDNGVVLGDPAAPRKLVMARENVNHFVPVLPFRVDVQDRIWRPW